jgi:hypothetical protein
MRRVSWECTRFISMSRGSLKAFKMASFVISWNTARYNAPQKCQPIVSI